MSRPAEHRALGGRGPAERGAAWFVTGPLGHLYAVLADIAVMGARHLAIRARRRLGR